MRLEDIAKQVIIPLIISAVMVTASSVYNAGTQKVLLENNIQVTSNLTTAVQDLRLQMAIYGEKYITREELERKLAPLYLLTKKE